MTPVSAARFRTLLGSFASGVTVVTTRVGDAPAGMTATAVASVSLDPPLLLVCVGRDSDFHAAITQAAAFAVNVLADDQERLSRQFADAALPDRLTGVPHRTDGHGLPLLDGAAAHIVCRMRATHEAGDHTIVVGEVVDGTTYPKAPLLHFRGGYRRLE